MNVWAASDAGPAAMTKAIDLLVAETPDLDEDERPAAMDYNARLVTRLRERGLWP